MFSKKIDIRVYYEDTDSGGIVYYANYFKYTERCRTEFLRELGVSQTKIYKDSGIKFIVHSVSMEYLNPSYLDDILKVETKVINLKKASIEFEQNKFFRMKATLKMHTSFGHVIFEYKHVRKNYKFNGNIDCTQES